MSLNSFDKNSTKYWEEILKNEGLDDIDKKEGFISNKTSENFLKIKKLLEGKNFSTIVEKLQKEKKIFIEINNEFSEIKFFDEKNGDLIGQISNSTYKSGKIEHDEHLFLLVENSYKGKGFGPILFGLYEKFADETGEKLIPKKEFTRKVSRINLYEKFGYEIVGKMILGNDELEDLLEEDYSLILEYLNNIKKGYFEEELPFNVLLERN